MAKKDDLITYGIIGLAVLALGYVYITSQKANGQGIAIGEPNPSAHKQGGCGCGMEPASHTDASSAVPSTS